MSECGKTSGSRHSAVTGFSEHGNETSGSIKEGDFLDQLSDYQLLKKEFVPWS